MKRAWLVTAFSLTLAGFGGCGPEEKYCIDYHTSCAQAKLDKAAREQAEEEERLRKLDALGTPSDGGAIVLD